MKLTLDHYVKVEDGVRSSKDRRIIVTRTIASYRDADGNEYRKSFETKTGETTIPLEGTHDELNKLKYQF